MRKSLIRIATIALAVVMLSTCIITSIIAGYSVADTCDVTLTQSQFGVTVEFTEDAGGEVLVPGGSGTLAKLTVSGDPTVDAEAVYTVTAFTIEGCTDAYCPIVITVNGTEYKMDATNDTVAKLQDAVKAAIEALDGTYEEEVIVIGWKWVSGVNDSEITNAKINLKMTATIQQVENN